MTAFKRPFGNPIGNAMNAALWLGLALLLAGCGNFSLVLPADTTSSLLRGCETKAPLGECAPGGIIIHHTWRFQ